MYAGDQRSGGGGVFPAYGQAPPSYQAPTSYGPAASYDRAPSYAGSSYSGSGYGAPSGYGAQSPSFGPPPATQTPLYESSRNLAGPRAGPSSLGAPPPGAPPGAPQHQQYNAPPNRAVIMKGSMADAMQALSNFERGQKRLKPETLAQAQSKAHNIKARATQLLRKVEEEVEKRSFKAALEALLAKLAGPCPGLTAIFRESLFTPNRKLPMHFWADEEDTMGVMADGKRRARATRIVFLGSLNPVSTDEPPEAAFEFKSILSSADLIVANLGAPVVRNDAKKTKWQRTLQSGREMSEAYLEAFLYNLDIDARRLLLSVANPYSADRNIGNPDGFLTTLQLLRTRGIRVIGTQEGGQAYLRVALRSGTVGFAAWTESTIPVPLTSAPSWNHLMGLGRVDCITREIVDVVHLEESKKSFIAKRRKQRADAEANRIAAEEAKAAKEGGAGVPLVGPDGRKSSIARAPPLSTRRASTAGGGGGASSRALQRGDSMASLYDEPSAGAALDLLIGFVDWGKPGTTQPTAGMAQSARQLMLNAEFDLIVGHGPSTLLPMEMLDSEVKEEAGGAGPPGGSGVAGPSSGKGGGGDAFGGGKKGGLIPPKKGGSILSSDPHANSEEVRAGLGGKMLLNLAPDAWDQQDLPKKGICLYSLGDVSTSEKSPLRRLGAMFEVVVSMTQIVEYHVYPYYIDSDPVTGRRIIQNVEKINDAEVRHLIREHLDKLYEIPREGEDPRGMGATAAAGGAART
eukprot:tig00021742_g23334.t1